MPRTTTCRVPAKPPHRQERQSARPTSVVHRTDLPVFPRPGRSLARDAAAARLLTRPAAGSGLRRPLVVRGTTRVAGAGPFSTVERPGVPPCAPPGYCELDIIDADGRRPRPAAPAASHS